MIVVPIHPTSLFPYKMILVVAMKALILVVLSSYVCGSSKSLSMARRGNFSIITSFQSGDERCLSMLESVGANRNGFLA